MRRTWFAALAVLLLSMPLVLGQTDPRPQRPRLVVLVSVDQLADWVLRAAEPWMGSDGFRRLQREGVRFESCALQHAVTYTGPGHATLSTGAPPSLHGIVGNEWLDPQTGTPIYCVADPDVAAAKGVSGRAALSPKLLLAPTLGDTMKAHLGSAARVISISWKDRAAILMGGRGADAAVWKAAGADGFTTSTWYGPTAPAWLVALNARHPERAYFKRKWQRVGPEEAYADLVDDRPFEGHDANRKRTFPHLVDGGKAQPGPAFWHQLYGSPFGNDLVLDVVQAALKSLDLGRRSRPDLLCVSLSTNDVIGHKYGPRSVEVRDATLRTDLQLARLLGLLDAQVGQGRYLLVLSADHGMSPAPAGLKALRQGADDRLAIQRASALCEAELRRRFGKPPAGVKNWVRGVRGAHLYLNRQALEAAHVQPVKAQDAAAQAALLDPGIVATLGLVRALRNQFPQDAIHRSLALSAHPLRSGDVLLAIAPYHVGYPRIVATHGAPYSYDQRIPLFVLGPGIRQGYHSYARVTSGAGVVLAAHSLGIPKPAMAWDDLAADALLR